MEKTCFKCAKLKPLSEFYRHGQMGDKHLNKCKSCTRSDVEARRKMLEATDPEWVLKEAERHRLKQERYRKLGTACVLSKEMQRAARRKFALKRPSQKRANEAASNAIRDKRLVRKPCSVCGHAKVQAHHEDYWKPLEVVWLCKKHHMARHVEINDAKRRAKVEAARAKVATLVLT